MVAHVRSSETGILRKLLLSLLVLGAISSLIGAGTFASFSALTTNANTFESGTVTMTNVAGNAVGGSSNCTTGASTVSGTCAILFNAGSTNLAPGGSASTNTVTITYTGSLTTSNFGLYTSNYGENGSSSELCTATNPGSKLNLIITVGTGGSPTELFNGTLAAFNTARSGQGNALQLNGGAQGAGAAGVWSAGDAAQYNIAISLASDADNTYQGCQQDITFNWYAAQ